MNNFKYPFLTLIAATLINSSSLFAQNIELPTRYVQNTNLGVNNIPENVKGSPYLNEVFSIGTVQIKSNEAYQAPMRYNAFNDEIEMKDGSQTIALMKRDYIKATINSELFAINSFKENGSLKQGYFVELNQGDAQLLHRKKIILKEGREATSSYSNDLPAQFDEQFSYFLKIGEQEALPIKLKAKDILSAFKGDSQYQKLEKYIKENRLKLKEEQEVVQFLNHYNSMI